MNEFFDDIDKFDLKTLTVPGWILVIGGFILILWICKKIFRDEVRKIQQAEKEL